MQNITYHLQKILILTSPLTRTFALDAVLASSKVGREEAHRQAGENIKRAKRKQERDYESRSKSSASNDIYISAEVLLRNKKRKDRNGGKFVFKWLELYVVSDITKKDLVTSKSKNDKEIVVINRPTWCSFMKS